MVTRAAGGQDDEAWRVRANAGPHHGDVVGSLAQDPGQHLWLLGDLGGHQGAWLVHVCLLTLR
jgi:hypothetical protein